MKLLYAVTLTGEDRSGLLSTSCVLQNLALQSLSSLLQSGFTPHVACIHLAAGPITVSGLCAKPVTHEAQAHLEYSFRVHSCELAAARCLYGLCHWQADADQMHSVGFLQKSQP